ncbi:MAG: glycosyltransferase family 2 protein [Caldisphaera sp.]|nr:MAG: glycosyltransferase family 2 protein [Caldisphaera sp.]
MFTHKLYAVVVTYKPKLEILEKCILSLKDQLNKIIIVDNTPDGCKDLESLRIFTNIEIIYLKNNYGIAYAQNVGIKKALEEKAHYILLSDQDTIYPSDFMEKMLVCFKDKVAAAGPLFLDIHTGKVQFFITKGKIGFKKIYPTSGKHEVLQLIASGTVINAKYLPDIGLMMEELFIDWVDMEWCWRAVSKGYRIIGNADIIIKHFHGESNKKILNKEINIKNPIRYYYTIRNAIFLSLHTKTLNAYHRIILFYKTIRNIVLFTVVSYNPFKTLKYAIKGFYHGIIGKLGKLDENH